jgi:murein DD-endopeptidase MepM/ murein hydrolase activator NlpD
MLNTKTLLAAASMLVLAGCAAQTPAPVVGRYEREQGALAQGSPSTYGRFTDRVSAKANGQQLPQKSYNVRTVSARKPAVQTEDITSIEPAAGPTQTASYGSRKTTNTRTPSQVSAPAVSVEMQSYKVKAGDTVFSLSRSFNTKPSAILEANGLESGALLEEGMLLSIPAGSGRLPATAGLGNGMPFNKAQTATAPEANVQNIEPAAGPETTPAPAQNKVLKGPSGQRYRMINHNDKQVKPEDVANLEPAAGRTPATSTDAEATYQNHTVQAGETIYRIAKMYDSSVLDMIVANEFSQPQELKSGTIIKVPVKQLAQPKTLATELKTAGLKTESALDETRRLMQPTEAEKNTPEQPLAQPKMASKQAKATSIQTAKAEELTEAEDSVVISKTSIAKPNMADINAKRGQIDKIAAKTRGLAWPVRGGDVIRRFGQQGDGVTHAGINISVPANTAVVAADVGKVLYANGGLKTYGNLVLIQHSNGMTTAYAHNNALLVKKGEMVKKGQVVALSGNSGNVDKPQLHFEIRRNAQAVDPMRVLASRS